MYTYVSTYMYIYIHIYMTICNYAYLPLSILYIHVHTYFFICLLQAEYSAIIKIPRVPQGVLTVAHLEPGCCTVRSVHCQNAWRPRVVLSGAIAARSNIAMRISEVPSNPSLIQLQL